MYVCMYVCMYIYIYIYIWSCSLQRAMPVDFGEIKRTDFLRQAVKVLVAGFPLSQGCTNKLAYAGETSGL